MSSSRNDADDRRCACSASEGNPLGSFRTRLLPPPPAQTPGHSCIRATTPSVDDVVDENRPTLNSLLRSSVVRFAYTYDFGDNWEHTIAFEKSEPAVEGQSYPVCIAGKRNCPPEDCGGVWGYEELLAILADPAHPEHAEQIDWTGEEFDPDEFDRQLANTVLAARFRKE